MLPRGVEMMVTSIVKMLGLDPTQMMSAVEDIRKSLHTAAADMATIRKQNSAIMSHLGISEPVIKDIDNELQQLARNVGGNAH